MKFCPCSPAHLKRGAVLLATASVVVAPLAVAGAASASTTGPALVISEVYGGGGNSGATYTNDYVELYNPGANAVDLSTYSVQYRSATNTGTGVTPLTGSIAPHAYYLVQEAGGTNGAALPTPQATGTLNFSATNGTVFLADQTGGLSLAVGDNTATAHVVDLVGFGTSNTFETAAAPAPSNSTAIHRDADVADSNDNSKDFVSGDGTPGVGVTPPSPTRDATIEQIQGNGSASPLVGDSVRTTGVVTATYATGGFNGFYLQTPGTGGAIDLGTHDTSDAVFVYAPADTAGLSKGDHVEVVGKVSEYNGLTEVNESSVTPLPAAAPVTPATVALPRSDAQRESLEGMLLAPQGDYTVADNYSLNQYGEIGLASGDTPLYQPTEVADPHDAAAIAAVEADNAARAVTLDDGESTNFFSTGKNTPLSYLTQDDEIRVGERVTFGEPVILDYRNAGWDFQPTYPVDGTTTVPVTFSHTRQAAPTATPGNVHIASFNVLNYFPTTGADWVSIPGNTCTWYDDRAGNHVTVNTCTNAAGDEGPRGAADQASFLRQQAKEVHAINHLGADVVSLEEIENSAKFGQDRDAAVSTLVTALNADAGPGTWKFVPTPSTAGDQSTEDVIRTAFIYKPAAVTPVGESEIDNAPAFDIARDPLAQAFQVAGTDASTRFGVIVNHFKSKGSGVDDGTGQGNANPNRIAQADELVRFADQVKSDFGTDRLFLSGDFNSYTKEDPMEHLYAAGYTDIGAHEAPDEHTYLFDGVVGSLDHVLANDAALQMVQGAHVWNINSVESVALEYSRYNYNATNFYTDAPFRASDHDPLVVGIADQPVAVDTTTTASVAPDHAVVKSTRPVVTAHVTSAGGPVDGGTVEVYDGATMLGSGTVSGGTASVTLPAFTSTGARTLDVRYGGTSAAHPSATTVAVTVVKATPHLTATPSSDPVARRQPWSATVTVSAENGPVTGVVTISEGSTLLGVARVSAGKATVAMPAYAKATKKGATHTLRVDFYGNDDVEAGSTTFTVAVGK